MKWYHVTLATTAAGVTTSVLAAYLISKVVTARVANAFEPPPYRVKGRLISVVIPTLEEEDYLPDLLTTIRNQTYQPIEVIVADSSSPPSREKTEELCQSHGARYVYVPKLNVALARNEGAREAQGEILIFIDSDCTLSPTYIEKVVGALEEGYVLAHGADMVGENVLFSIGSVITRSWLKPSAYTTGRGIAIWKDAFFGIGAYDEDLDPITGVREDLDLGRKVAERFGHGAIKLLRGAWLVEDPRRISYLGAASWWKARGVRNSRLIPL